MPERFSSVVKGRRSIGRRVKSLNTKIKAMSINERLTKENEEEERRWKIRADKKKEIKNTIKTNK